MKTSANICPNCGKESSGEFEECTICGDLKAEYLPNMDIKNSLIRSLSLKFNQFENSRAFLHLFFHSLSIVIAFIFIPQFIKESFLFLFTIILFNTTNILRNIELYLNRSEYLSRLVCYFGIGYLGAGVGNIISNTGLNTYSSFGEYFYLKSIIDEFHSANYFLLILGAVIAIIVHVMLRKFYYSFIKN